MEDCVIIYNPFAGKKKAQSLSDKLNRLINQSIYKVKVVKSDYPGHAFVLAAQAVHNQAALVVAAGGDGTVNEVAKALVGSRSALAIVPAGSGNGLARALRLSANLNKLAYLINNKQIKLIDCGLFKDNYFFSVAGVGFDAEIANLFATNKKRGFLNYVPIVIKQLLMLKINRLKLLEPKPQAGEYACYWLSCFNGLTYGGFLRPNPAYKLDDGLLELILVKNVSFWHFPTIALKIIFGLPRTNSTVVFQLASKKFVFELLSADKTHLAHIDGEPFRFKGQIKIKLVPQALRVVCP